MLLKLQALLADADVLAIGWKADAEPAGPPSTYAEAIKETVIFRSIMGGGDGRTTSQLSAHVFPLINDPKSDVAGCFPIRGEIGIFVKKSSHNTTCHNAGEGNDRNERSSQHHKVPNKVIWYHRCRICHNISVV